MAMNRRTSIDYSPGFEEFWALYPRRVNKQGAFKKYEDMTVKHKIPHDDIIQATKNYVQICKDKNTGVSFMLHPATFLGPRDRWREYLEVDPMYGYKAEIVEKLLGMLSEYWVKPVNEVRTKQELKDMIDSCYNEDEVKSMAYEIRDKMNAYNEEIAIKGTEDKYIAEAHNWLKRLR